jgi:hypothetical protein
MVGVVPPLRDLKSEEDLRREADLARDKPVQDMLDALGIDYPGGYSSRLPEPYQSTMRLLSKARDASGSSSGGIGGLKLADVTLNIFPDMALRQGHAGVSVAKDPSIGFYPADRSDWVSQLGGRTMPGQARRDDMSQDRISRTYRTSPAQDTAMRAYIRQHAHDPYDLYENNCIDWARQVLNAGGVKTKEAWHHRPNSFFSSQK